MRPAPWGCGPAGKTRESSGPTEEDVTHRTPRRAALAAAGSLIIAVRSSTNPAPPTPRQQAAPIALPATFATARAALADRVERALAPPASRRPLRVKVRAVVHRMKAVRRAPHTRAAHHVRHRVRQQTVRLFAHAGAAVDYA